MIIGAVALVLILFGGGLDTFFISELEKGVKEYVQDKDRRDEIQAGIKDTKKNIKAFNKERKSYFKQFKKLNISRATTSAELDDFSDQMLTYRKAFQHRMIDDRLQLAANLKADEWASIILLSNKTIEEREKKARAKAQKGSDKNKEQKNTAIFEDTRSVLAETVSEEPRLHTLTEGLNKLVRAVEQLELKIRSINQKENKTIALQYASRKDLESIANNTLKTGQVGFKMLNEFHFLVLNNTSEAEFDEIMKAFSKELEISIR